MPSYDIYDNNLEPINDEKYKMNGYAAGSFVNGGDVFSIIIGVRSVIVSGPSVLYVRYIQKGQNYSTHHHPKKH